jgi:hypothetical protein
MYSAAGILPGGFGAENQAGPFRPAGSSYIIAMFMQMAKEISH